MASNVVRGRIMAHWNTSVEHAAGLPTNDQEPFRGQLPGPAMGAVSVLAGPENRTGPVSRQIHLRGHTAQRAAKTFPVSGNPQWRGERHRRAPEASILRSDASASGLRVKAEGGCRKMACNNRPAQTPEGEAAKRDAGCHQVLPDNKRTDGRLFWAKGTQLAPPESDPGISSTGRLRCQTRSKPDDGIFPSATIRFLCLVSGAKKSGSRAV